VFDCHNFHTGSFESPGRSWVPSYSLHDPNFQLGNHLNHIDMEAGLDFPNLQTSLFENYDHNL
jgi:hypothetical protein